jgi:TP901 family phage tail tape measure protein
MAKKDTTRTVDLVINGQRAKASLQEIKVAVGALTRSFNLMREADNPEEWRKKQAALMKMKQTYREMNAELNNTATASGKFMANFKTIAAGVIGGNLITGAFMGIQAVITKGIDAITKKADELSNIQKTTGLVGKDLEELEKRLGAIDTRTGRSELRDLATEAGKLGYEGVDNIAKFVKEADTIKVALGEDLGEDAIIKISKASKQFGEGMLNIASGVNAVGAASEATEGYLVDFMSRVAPLAQVANIAAGDILGYAATLDQAGLQTEMAGTALNTFFGDFIKNTEDFGRTAGFAQGELSKIASDSGFNEAFLQMLTQLKAANPEAKDFLKKLEQMGIDGARGSTVFLSLANNLDNVRANQKLANEEVKKGTSVLDEYNIRNNNAAANYEKALKKLNQLLLPFIEKIGQLSVGVVSFLADNAKGLWAMAKAFSPVLSSISTLSKFWERLGPIAKETADAVDHTRRRNDKYNESLAHEVDVLDVLFNATKKANTGSAERAERIDVINSRYGTTLKNLTDESAFIAQLDGAYRSLVDSMGRKIAMNIKQGELTPIIQRRLAIEKELEQREAKATLTYERWRAIQSELVELAAKEGQIIKDMQNIGPKVSGASNVSTITPTATSASTTPKSRKSSAADDSAKIRAKEIENLKKELDQIAAETEKHLREVALLHLDADQVEMERLNQAYEDKFNKLQEYQATVMSSTQLSDAEREALLAGALLAERQLIGAHQAELEAKRLEADTRTAAQRAIDQETLRTALLSEQELELEEVNAYYDKLELLAQGNADTLALINQKRAEAITAINTTAGQKDLTDAQNIADAKKQIALSVMDTLTNVANLTGKIGAEMNDFQKAVALASIAVNMAIAIGEAVKDSQVAGITPLDKALIFTAAVAQITAGIAQAKSVLSQADSQKPIAPQFYGGGLTDVYGADDGRKYAARQIGSIAGGGAVNGVSLGLLGERGAEFVIPNNVYTNPANANLMTALSSTVKNAASGGGTAVAGGGSGADAVDLKTNNALLQQLIGVLSKPIQATTYLDMQELEDSLELRSKSKSAAEM